MENQGHFLSNRKSLLHQRVLKAFPSGNEKPQKPVTNTHTITRISCAESPARSLILHKTTTTASNCFTRRGKFKTLGCPTAQMG